jgi:hypothetical protein
MLGWFFLKNPFIWFEQDIYFRFKYKKKLKTMSEKDANNIIIIIIIIIIKKGL